MKRFVWVLFYFVFSAVAFAQENGWIGVRIEDQPDRGAIIRSVEPNSPAEKTGLRTGDVIIEFNKESVIGMQQLTRLVRETPVGRTVEIRVRRDNKDQTFQITTERTTLGRIGNGRIQLKLPDVRIYTDRILRDRPRIQINTTYIQSGIRVEQLTDQLRGYFGVLSNAGVLVASVDQNSAAEKAGLKAGDVITAVDGKTVRNPAEFSREMRAGSSRIVLKVVRDKQERDITIETTAR